MSAIGGASTSPTPSSRGCAAPRTPEAMTAKVVATLPERQAREAAHAVLHLYRRRTREVPQRDLATLREAAWEERAVDLLYRDEHGRAMTRRVWPLVIAYADETLALLAWCTLRMGFRHFRLDRIEAATATDDSFRPRRAGLLREYLAERE